MAVSQKKDNEVEDDGEARDDWLEVEQGHAEIEHRDDKDGGREAHREVGNNKERLIGLEACAKDLTA